MIHGKGIVAFMISMLMVCFVGNLFLIENCSAAGNILYVGGGGPGNYTKIQDAINNAINGDTIFVFSGTQYNENVYIDKSLDLIGIGSSKPVINGKDPVKSTIEIMSDQVTISNFVIHNSISSTYSGIAIGKTLYQNEDYTAVTILNCYISNTQRGILMRGSSHTVNLCEINSNLNYAIDIISGGTSNTLTENVINDNLRGINLQSNCANNIIRDNTVSGNRDYGIHIGAGCSNNQIYHNRFIQNYPHQVCDIGTNNSWDNGYPSGGNNWSDYTGYDNYSGSNQDIPGSDGIGDIPYNIPDGQNKDNYPIGVIQTPQQPGDENQIPIAYIISISPNPVESGQLVSLTGSGSDGNGFITAYEWKSTIDGKISSEPIFQTTNLSIGTHTISFKVMDNEGAWSTEKTGTVTINAAVNQAPIAYIDEITPNPAQQGEPVIFRGHGSDEDGVITTYKWLSSKDGTIGTTSSFIKANLSRGTHTIYFQVKDDIEWSIQVVATLTIERNSSSGNPENHAPHAYLGGPYTGKVNEAITFNGSLSYDEEGTILGYWNFGDSFTGNGLTASHIYTAPGTYTVVLTVTDEDGVSSTVTTSAIITRSSSSGNTVEGFSLLDFEIPFPVLMVIVVLLIVGILVGFIFKIQQR